MKIRTVTTGISLQSPGEEGAIRQAAEFGCGARDFFEGYGYEVQETRMATNSWEGYLPGLSTWGIVSEVQRIERVCQSLDVSCVNVGYASDPESIAVVPEIVRNTGITYCSSRIGDLGNGIDFGNIKASAEAIKRISEETENGYGNFRFCAWANCMPARR